MSTTATHRRALLAMAGATAALATVLTPSASYAVADNQPLVDSREPSAGAGVGSAGLGTAAQANPTANQTPARVITTQQRSVAAEQVNALVSCSRSARIDADRSANRYKVSGSMSCNANGYLRMRCKPVHRHTAYWHSHAWAFDVTRFGSSLSQSSGPINGTNGDTYKTNCQYWFNGTYLGSVESGTVTL